MIHSLADLTLRTRLNLLILSALIPALGISIYTVFEQRREAITGAENSASRLVTELVQTEQGLAAGTRLMLGTLAELPEVRNHDAAACSRLFGALLSRYPQYVTIQAADADGRLFASGKPLAGSISIGNRKHFRDAVATGEFSPGEFVSDRYSGRPVFNYALPVTGREGRTSTVLQAGVGLDYLDRQFSGVRLPPGTTVVITDHAGTIMYRNYDTKQAIGRPDSAKLFQLMQTGGSGGFFPGTRGAPSVSCRHSAQHAMRPARRRTSMSGSPSPRTMSTGCWRGLR